MSTPGQPQYPGDHPSRLGAATGAADPYAAAPSYPSPSYPSPSYPGGAGLPAERPRTVDLAFWCWILTTVISLIGLVLTLTSSWTTDVRLRSHSTLEGRRSSIDGHRHILEAIQSRDATGAGIAMRDHLSDVAILIRGHQH